jgi:hypothetical protein
VSKPDLYLEPLDIRDIIFVGFAAFADAVARGFAADNRLHAGDG